MGSTVLDVAIGMVFVYLLLSLVASVVQEILSTFMQLRSANLQTAIHSLFSGNSLWGKSLVDSIYSHGLVRGLYLDPKQDSGVQQLSAKRRAGDWLRGVLRKLIGIHPIFEVRDVGSGEAPNQFLLPAYIPSRTFAQALIGILNPGNLSGGDAMRAIHGSLAAHHWSYRDNKAGQALLTLATEAQGDIAAFQKKLEDWYADSMDRASAWYKKYTQRVLLVIGLVLAVALNVDSTRVAGTLWTDRDVRQAMVDAASNYKASNEAQPATGSVGASGSTSISGDTGVAGVTGAAASTGLDTLRQDLQKRVDDFQSISKASLLPVGWKRSPLHYLHQSDPDLWTKGLRSLLGWLVTALAISLGAPFWFDLLNKFMVVRGTVKPQEKSQTEPSKDD